MCHRNVSARPPWAVHRQTLHLASSALARLCAAISSSSDVQMASSGLPRRQLRRRLHAACPLRRCHANGMERAHAGVRQVHCRRRARGDLAHGHVPGGWPGVCSGWRRRGWHELWARWCARTWRARGTHVPAASLALAMRKRRSGGPHGAQRASAPGRRRFGASGPPLCGLCVCLRRPRHRKAPRRSEPPPPVPKASSTMEERGRPPRASSEARARANVRATADVRQPRQHRVTSPMRAVASTSAAILGLLPGARLSSAPRSRCMLPASCPGDGTRSFRDRVCVCVCVYGCRGSSEPSALSFCADWQDQRVGGVTQETSPGAGGSPQRYLAQARAVSANLRREPRLPGSLLPRLLSRQLRPADLPALASEELAPARVREERRRARERAMEACTARPGQPQNVMVSCAQVRGFAAGLL